MMKHAWAAGLSMISVSALAQITVPHTFTANTAISSTQMNNNFTAITGILNSYSTTVSTQTLNLQYGANSIFLSAPAGLSSAYNLKLPMNPGTNGSVLTTDGTGNTFWTAGSGNPATGLSMTGILTLANNPTAPMQAATKQYVDGQFDSSASILGNSVSSPMVLGTQTNFPLQLTTNGAQRLIVTEMGKFGFGTMTPSHTYAFHSSLQGGSIYGAKFQSEVDLTTASGGYRANEIVITETGSGPATAPTKKFLIMTKNSTPRYIFDDEGTKTYDSTGSYYLKTKVTSGGTNFESSGPLSFSAPGVGIGTSSPSDALHVVGNAVATGTFSTLSDRRFKKDVQPVSGALEKIQKLEGVSYDWKEKKSYHHGRELGVIAQDVEKVFPEAVRTDKHGIKSVSYNALISPLINAVKELKAENDMLKGYLCRQDPSAPFCKN